MRNLLCILLVFSCLFAVTGCSKEESVPENFIPVYYKKAIPDYGAEEGIIGKTYLDISGQSDEQINLLNLYLASDPGEDFTATFPENVSIVRFDVEALTAKVVFSSQISIFTGMDLTIALTCLTRTILSLTDCQEVIFSAEDVLLHGAKFVTLTPDSFLFVDNSGQPEQ